MSRRKIDSAPELGVCRRWAEARDSLRIPQTTAANILGITRNKLTSYESGTVAVPSEIGLRFCSTFGFSQLWLATGELPRRVNVPVDRHLLFRPEQTFFEFVSAEAEYFRDYHAFLAFRLGIEVGELDAIDLTGTEPLRPPFGEWRGLAHTAANLITRFAERMPVHLHRSLLESLVRQLVGFENRNADAIESWLKEVTQIRFFEHDPNAKFLGQMLNRRNEHLIRAPKKEAEAVRRSPSRGAGRPLVPAPLAESFSVKTHPAEHLSPRKRKASHLAR